MAGARPEPTLLMLDRLFPQTITVQVTVLGVVGRHMVRHSGPVRVRKPATVAAALTAAGRAAGVDLLAALELGDQPAVLLNGLRLDLPDGLKEPVADGAKLSWLMPMAGG